MGSGISSPESLGGSKLTNSMRVSRRNKIVQSNTLSANGNALPPPISLSSEEEALSVGYTQEDINQYKSSFEYFERIKSEHVPTNVSLPLKTPNAAHLFEGAAGLVIPRRASLKNGNNLNCKSLSLSTASNPISIQSYGNNIQLSSRRGVGRKTETTSLWDQISGVHLIKSNLSENDITQSCEKIIKEVMEGGCTDNNFKAIIVGNGEKSNNGKTILRVVSELLNRNISVTIVYQPNIMEIGMNGINVPRLAPDLWTVDVEQYYLSLLRSIGVTIVVGNASKIKVDDESGWVEKLMVGTDGQFIKSNLVVVVSNEDGINDDDDSITNTNVVYNRWSWLSVGRITDDISTVEFGNISGIVKQQLTDERLKLNMNQARRREVQGHDRALILGEGQTSGKIISKKFGIMYVNEESTIVGFFFEGGSEEENQHYIAKIGTKIS